MRIFYVLRMEPNMAGSPTSRMMRLRRKKRIAKKLRGSAERPRISFFKSSRHIYVQVIDDEKGSTLASVHSFKTASDSKKGLQRAGVDVCRELGEKLGEKCKEKGISRVVFDRGGFPYQGRVQAFAEGAREQGLMF